MESISIGGNRILAVAFIFGVWGFFRNSPIKAGSADSQNPPTEITKNSANKNKSIVDGETGEVSPDTKSAVPVALINAGEFDENIYDAAKTDDWNTADEKLKALKASVEKLNSKTICSATLDKSLATLEKLVSAKDKKATLLESNKFMFDATELSAKYNPTIPIEVTKLDFYGREIEVWA